MTVQDYRIVELRPDVFSVEKHKAIAWYLWWIKDWQPILAYTVPGIPEYSPLHVVEFTREQADRFIAEARENDEIERLRKKPPTGYPRVVD